MFKFYHIQYVTRCVVIDEIEKNTRSLNQNILLVDEQEMKSMLI